MASNNQQPSDLAGVTLPAGTWSYDIKDVILYALSVGATPEELHLIYENTPDFRALPTFATLCWNPVPLVGQFSGLPLHRLLHGEHTLELFGELPLEVEKMDVKTRVGKVYDTGKHMLVEIISEGSLNGELLVRNTGVGIVPGAGGFGGEKRGKVVPLTIPAIVPHISVKNQVPKQQAALYRLNGDYNPIHIDPKLAQAAGLQQPILHGLCTLGYSTRSIVRHLRSFTKVHDPSAGVPHISKLDVRFLKPVIPGQSITTRVWTTGPDTVVFETLVVEDAGPNGSTASQSKSQEPTRVLEGTIKFANNVQLAPPRARL